LSAPYREQAAASSAAGFEAAAPWQYCETLFSDNFLAPLRVFERADVFDFGVFGPLRPQTTPCEKIT
jgi:hypothetical protein